MKKKVTENTVLSDILDYPGAERILTEHKLPCLSCSMSGSEMHLLKLGDVCKAYGINIKELLKELNRTVKNYD